MCGAVHTASEDVFERPAAAVRDAAKFAGLASVLHDASTQSCGFFVYLCSLVVRSTPQVLKTLAD